MLRSLALFFFLLVSLHAQSDTELLKRANSLVHSSSKAQQFRAYNDFKNLYLRALMNDKQTLRIKALEGIVKSGKKLHIDVSDYAKELESYKKKRKRHTKQKSKKKQVYTKKQKEKKKKIYVRSSHKLKSIRWQNGRLVLTFDKKLKNNQINYFTLYDKKTKRYKYVFDIHASMLMRSQTLRKRGIEKIQLAQFNQNTLRLVFKNPKKLSVRFKKDSNKLIIRAEAKEKDSSAVLKKRTQRVTAKKAPTRLDRNKVIVIDAGHGGKDPGAIGYRGLKEKDVVLKIAQELRNILRARGYKVYMTRDRDVFIKLRHRTKYANRKKADLFISIHANAVGRKDAKKVQGVECYFLSKSRSSRAKKVAAMENSADLDDMNFYGKESFLNTLNYHNIIAANKLAIDLQRGALGELKKSYKNVCDAGVREGPFWVLVGAQMPAVLVEVGFITHPAEGKRLASRKYRKKLARGLANGVERYFLNN
jgi:N-acetylmuramoyl-L-alanine amidase